MEPGRCFAHFTLIFAAPFDDPSAPLTSSAAPARTLSYQNCQQTSNISLAAVAICQQRLTATGGINHPASAFDLSQTFCTGARSVLLDISPSPSLFLTSLLTTSFCSHRISTVPPPPAATASLPQPLLSLRPSISSWPLARDQSIRGIPASSPSAGQYPLPS